MIRMVAFDFDGTLADSVPLCLEVFDRVFAEYLGAKAPTHEKLFSYFGQNELGILHDELGRRIPEAEDQLLALHRELHPRYAPAPLPGCRELLEFLQQRGVRLAFLTGRAEPTGSYSLEYLGLRKYFLDFQFGSPCGNKKGVQLSALLQKYALAPDELIYVGDAVSDVAACREAGVVCFSAAWAASADVPALENINPGLVFRSPDELREYWVAHSLP